MCQLLGMNCNVPTDIVFSFEGFRARGGATDHHSDGWGIAFFEGRGCRVFLDPRPAADSPVADLVRRYPIHSTHVIAHIRKATRGKIGLQNTHPFMRELWGRYWIFAHNGTLRNFHPPLEGRYRPVGSTDSEAAFCRLLEILHGRSPKRQPPLESLHRILAEASRGLARHGRFNYLLSNGEILFCHCSTRLSYVLRRAPFPTAHLADRDIAVDFNKVTRPDDQVAIIATVPLTDNEPWVSFRPGELIAFRDGAPALTSLPLGRKASEQPGTPGLTASA